jgi:hypothetical protein
VEAAAIWSRRCGSVRPWGPLVPDPNETGFIWVRAEPILHLFLCAGQRLVLVKQHALPCVIAPPAFGSSGHTISDKVKKRERKSTEKLKNCSKFKKNQNLFDISKFQSMQFRKQILEHA